MTTQEINVKAALAATVGLATLMLATVAISAYIERTQIDVFDMDSSRILKSLDETDSLPPLFPLQKKDYIGLSCAIASLCLAASSGLGGGGLLIPIYILILDFPVKQAISLTAVTVLGGAIANNMLYCNKKHPEHSDRYCIDWDLILLMEPATIAGAVIGASFANFMPEKVLVIMLFLLLSITAYRTLQKANKLHARETENFRASQIAINEAEQQALLGEVSIGEQEYSATNEQNTATLPIHKDDMIVNAVKGNQILRDLMRIIGLFAAISIINLLKGGPGSGGGIFGLDSCGETCFWVSQGLMLLITILFALWCRQDLLLRLRSGGPVLSDIAWNEQNSITYPSLAVVAGLVAGLFGVGGGLVKGPLMLALGVNPAVASATSACMIFFTSSTVVISYIIFGMLVYDYAIFCFLLGLVATFFGQTAMALIMKRYKRQSLIAYSIGLVVAISAVAMTIEAVLVMRTEGKLV